MNHLLTKLIDAYIMKCVYLPLLFMFISVSSCAHKSGHKGRETIIQTTSNEETITDTDDYDIIDSEVSPNQKDESDDKTSHYKLDGSEIFAKYNTAVFMVFTSDGYQGYQGSGFFINPNGLAVSNYHVFQGTNVGAEHIKLANGDCIYKVVEVICSNEEEDFILFKVNAYNTNYIPISESKPQVGEKVYAIGSPRGLENTFSSGEVSQWRATNLMQISALIDHGSSGGALINEQGEVVGITSGTFADGSQANLNYAWSIDVIKPYVSIVNAP